MAARRKAAKKTTARKSSARKRSGSSGAERGARAGRKRSARPATPNEIQLLTDRGERFPIKIDAGLDRAAMAWSYIVRNRSRWKGDGRSARSQAVRSLRQIEALGIDRAAVEEIAASNVVEVRIPWIDEETHWAARVMPWEYILSSAAGACCHQGVIVVRHLDRGDSRQPPRRAAERASLVLCNPGAIADEYDWDVERLLPNEGIDGTCQEQLAPTRAQLRTHIKQHQPELVHVGGVDSHEGAELLGHQQRERLLDGVVLAHGRSGYEIVTAEELARLLNAGKAKPRLVVCNLYRSAARIAALAVAEGAGAAIGFQDTFDDIQAELFIAAFYRAWKESNQSPLVSFQVAWKELQSETDDFEGSGLVLWSDRSLLEEVEEPTAFRQRAARVARDVHAVEVRHDTVQAAAADLIVTDASIEPYAKLNYSLLHNRWPMFEKFELRNSWKSQRRIEEVSIDVRLFAGDEVLPYQSTVSVGLSPRSLRDEIFVPLTSQLARSLRESIRTGLQVSIRIGEHSVYDKMHRVTLLPINEWVDDDVNRQWLPSFVYPLDRAIRRIVDAAQPYLCTLRDDATAGFDGYQSIDPNADDPTEMVDRQVQAIWAALVHEMPLGYVNPPPTYTTASQRLRTPSDVIDGRRGTCIDLALCFAACLEYVDIYPVMFLLEGHAFPGYWRDPDRWADFVDMQHVHELGVEVLERMAPRDEERTLYPWLFPTSDRESIMDQVRAGHLVPLETTLLTTRAGFVEALDEGWENLLNPDEFHSVIDVQRARECDVTPLPTHERES